MDTATLIDSITRELREDALFRGLFLTGSHGRGSADAFSDVDLVALVDADAQSLAVLRWIQVLEGIAPVVYWNQRGLDPVLLNAITDEWLRCDLVITSPDRFAGRARDTVRPLIDRDDVFASLPASLPVTSPDPDRVRRLIDEFLRVLGLLHVVVGRDETVLASAGAGLLRDTLIELLIAAHDPARRGGALHLRGLIDEDDLAMLESLPVPAPARSDVIAAHFALAHAFLPRARALATKLSVPWPRRFEQATLTLLARACSEGGRFDWLALKD